jgi:hypothetical protein
MKNGDLSDLPKEMGTCVFTIIFALLIFFTSLPARALDKEWFILGRYSQGPANYRAVQADLTYEATSSAIVDLGSIELRFRDPVFPARRRRWEGSFQYEGLSQTVLNVSHLTHRGTARISYGADTFITGRWRTAGVLQVSYGNYLLLDLRGPQRGTQETVSKTSIGLGPEFMHRIRKIPAFIGHNGRDLLEFSVSGVAKLEIPGTSTILPNLPKPTFGVEARGSMVWWLGTNTFVEGRYRWVHERFQWVPARGSYDNVFETQFGIIDFGLGHRF